MSRYIEMAHRVPTLASVDDGHDLLLRSPIASELTKSPVRRTKVSPKIPPILPSLVTGAVGIAL